MGKRRATTVDEQAARRKQILTATAMLLEQWSLDDVNVDRIASLAGVAKGTVYLYFRTREELVLEVFSAHHREWLGALEAELRSSASSLTPPAVGRLTVATLLRDPLLVRLYGRLNELLLGSVSPEAVRRFRSEQNRRIGSVADALGGRLPGLTVARAQKWLLRFEAFVAGFAPHVHVRHAVTEALETSAPDTLRLDLESELQYIAATMLLSP